MRLLPPLLWILMLGLIGTCYWTGWGPAILPAPGRWTGVGLFVLGLAMTIIANRHFRRVQTNIYTYRDPNILVTDGLFAVSRNPMYLGFSLSLIGAALLANEWLALLPAGFFIAVSHFHYIPFEEGAAERVFEDDWRAYKARVRRWI